MCIQYNCKRFKFTFNFNSTFYLSLFNIFDDFYHFTERQRMQKQPLRTHKQLTKASTQQMGLSSQSALPQDIHSSALSPEQNSLSAKTSAISSRLSQTSLTHPQRKMQVLGRGDPNSVLSAKRSSSRGAAQRAGDPRQAKTDRRPDIEDSLYTRPESHMSLGKDGEETTKGTLDPQMQSRGQEINTSVLGSLAIPSSLRDSHESMRNIQKQRIQRSLQKSQEGRRKLEEKLEAISSRDRQLLGSGAGHTGATLDERTAEKTENNSLKYDSQLSGSGSLLATKGGYYNLRNKDQIKDQMLASISKIRSFRETGEFDVDQHDYSAAEHMSGDGTPYLDQQHIQSNRMRTSELMVDSSLDATTRQPPEKIHNRNARVNDTLEANENFSNLSSIQNYHSTKSTKTTNISTHLSMINEQLKNKVCSNIEEAQPYLKTCLIIGGNGFGNTLTNVTSALSSMQLADDQLTSLLSGGGDGIELDKNLLCVKCQFIVVHPVECQSCQSINCFKCTQHGEGVCEDAECTGQFGTTPGKVHKLYKEMLNQLEFRCPNQAMGCNIILKYDALDKHLQHHCEGRMLPCPNRCSKNKKFSLPELKRHVEEECPKECVPCPRCKQIKYRSEMDEHLSGSCDKVIVKCPNCDMEDLRIAFRTGKHECQEQDEDENIESVISLRHRDNNRDKGVRNFEEVLNRKNNTKPLNTQESRTDDDLEERPVTQAEFKAIKQEFQDIQNVLTVGVFEMIATLQKGLAEREDEVIELIKTNRQTKHDLSDLAKFNVDLEKKLEKSQEQVRRLEQQLSTQIVRHEDYVAQSKVKQGDNHQKIECLEALIINQMKQYEKKLQSQDDKIKELNQAMTLQANKHAELLAKLSVKQEQTTSRLNNHEEVLNQLSETTGTLLDDFSAKIERRDLKVNELEKVVMQFTTFQDAQNKKIEGQLKEFSASLNGIKSSQINSHDELSRIIDKAMSAQRPKVSSPRQEENKFTETQLLSQVSESLDDEIIAMHYEQQKEEQRHQPRTLKVPPINIQNASANSASKQKNSSKGRRSPKPQKQFIEDFNKKSSSQSIEQHYQTQPSESTMPQILKVNEKISKTQLRKEAESPEKQNYKFQELEEIAEDVDESQFIPTYLSSTENDGLTDLNRTELNTEYNTSRPHGGQTDRQRQKVSARRTNREYGGGTDRGNGIPISEIQSQLSYQVSQSTIPRLKQNAKQLGNSDSLSDDIGRGSMQPPQYENSEPLSGLQQQQKTLCRDKAESANSFGNDSEPEIAANFTELQMEVRNLKQEPEHKSIPRTSIHQYNEALMKTFESSEFELQQSPDQLPGMIFGLGSKVNQKPQPIKSQNQKDVRISQLSGDQSLGQSLVNLQVNVDFANPSLTLKQQQSSEENKTQLEARVSNKIDQESSLCQSVKLAKKKSNFDDFTNDNSQKKMIEHELEKLANKYGKDQANAKSQGKTKPQKVSMKESSSSLERDERVPMSGSVDDLLQNILQGDDMFQNKQKARQMMGNLQALEQKSNEPFEVAKQESRESLTSGGTQGEIMKIAAKANRVSEPTEFEEVVNARWGVETENGDMINGRESMTSQPLTDTEKQGPPGFFPVPTALESDLETILETDQESNYMTTTRTHHQLKALKPPKESSEAVLCQTLPKNSQLIQSSWQMPDAELMNQSLYSLNNSSFVLNDGISCPLPNTLFSMQDPFSQKGGKDASEPEAPSTARKTTQTQNKFLSEISPIAPNLDMSSSLQQANGVSPAHSINLEDICIQLQNSVGRQAQLEVIKEATLDYSSHELSQIDSKQEVADCAQPDQLTQSKINEILNEDLDKQEQSNLDRQEERIKQYQNRVLSAISVSAKKKQEEQYNILKQIESKKSDKSSLRAQTPGIARETSASDQSNIVPDQKQVRQSSQNRIKDLNAGYEDVLDRESIAKELQEVIQRNKKLFQMNIKDNEVLK